MKAKYIILSAVAVVLAAACQKEGAQVLSEFQADKLYVTIPEAGGSASINVTATEAWSFDIDIPKDTTVRTETGKKKKTIEVNQLEEYPWVAISPVSGTAGTTKITFTDNRDEKDESSYTQTFKVKVGEHKTQDIIVMVGTPAAAAKATVKQLLGKEEGFAPVDGKTYQVTGACTRIASTSYGNWYLKDASTDETLYIYGTVDATGSYNWSSFGIETGDVVTVEGPYKVYNGTVELVDASVIKVTKSLLSSVKGSTIYVGKEKKEFELEIKKKGTGLGFESKTDWLKLGTSYTMNSKGNLVFTVTPEENNTGKVRTGTLSFISTKDGELPSEVTVTISQQAATTKGGVKDIRDICASSTSSKAQAAFDVELDNEILVTYVNGKYIFVEDKTGGLILYNSASKYSAGQKISGRVFGKGYAYGGVAQGTDFNAALGKTEKAPADPAKLPKGTEITLQKLLDEWDTYAFRLVTIKGLTVTDAIDATYPVSTGKDERHPVMDGTNEKTDPGDIEGTITDGTNEVAIRINSDDSFKLKMEKGKKYDVTCIPTVREKIKTLGLWDAAHIAESK